MAINTELPLISTTHQNQAAPAAAPPPLIAPPPLDTLLIIHPVTLPVWTPPTACPVALPPLLMVPCPAAHPPLTAPPMACSRLMAPLQLMIVVLPQLPEVAQLHSQAVLVWQLT